jgi:hypothetical protein
MSTAIRPVARSRRTPAPDPHLAPPTAPAAGDLTPEQCRALRAVYDLILAHVQPAGTP